MATSATRSRVKPTTRQLHEAERIQARLGRVQTLHDGGAYVVQVYGDDPSAKTPHRVISLDRDGNVVANIEHRYVAPEDAGESA